MSVREVGVVDMLRVESETGDIVLDLIDEEDWSDEQGHLEALQEKLNSYLAFIEGGQLYRQLAAEGKTVAPGQLPVRVNIVARCPVPPRVQRFVEYAMRTFEGAGFGLTHRVVPL